MDPALTPMLIGLGVNAVRGGIAAGRNAGLKRDFQQADAAVNPIDPNQIAFLNRLRSQEQRFRAGTDPSSAFAMQGVQQQGAQTQRNMLRAGGPGSVGNMLRAQQVTNQGVAGVGAQAAAMGNQLLGMQQGMTNLIADRVYNRQRELSNRALAMWQQNRQDVQNAISGITSTLPDVASNDVWKRNSSANPASAPMAPERFGGGLVGDQWAPSVQAGINYSGMGTGIQQPQSNYGLMPQQPQRPNYGFRY